jgi:hypothetical protein
MVMVMIAIMVAATVVPAILAPTVVVAIVAATMPVAVATAWENTARQGERYGESQQSRSKFHDSFPCRYGRMKHRYTRSIFAV